jgi:hypothetical protein
MTIDSGWVRVMKEEVPAAFTKKCQFDAKCAVLDGMPLLMAGGHIEEWRDLIQRNFYYAINNYFNRGVPVVVLAFDDYTYVSNAKSITQANRSKKVAEFNFNERQYLEPKVPKDFNEKLRNRVYKRMVIDCIVASIPKMLDLKNDRSFIIDYVECPIRYFYNQETRKLDMEYMQLPPMGENDIKFTRFARIYGDCIAHSVDGDYLPIALLEHEAQIATKGQDQDPFKIAIYRLEYNMSPTTRAPKRTANGENKKGMSHQSSLPAYWTDSSSTPE